LPTLAVWQSVFVLVQPAAADYGAGSYLRQVVTMASITSFRVGLVCSVLAAVVVPAQTGAAPAPAAPSTHKRRHRRPAGMGRRDRRSRPRRRSADPSPHRRARARAC